MSRVQRFESAQWASFRHATQEPPELHQPPGHDAPVRAGCVHEKPEQTSFVQTLPSSGQPVPAGTAPSAEQLALDPVHASAASQGPALARHTVLGDA
jgi:hypothetical protein